MNKGILNFREFVEKCFPNYLIDEDNEEVINLVTKYLARDPSFHDISNGYHLDKSLLIMGDTGTGKTDLMKMQSTYLKEYLRSPYAFKFAVVWSFTAEFNKNGYTALDTQSSGNMYYDELCLTNENTGFPEKERAMHFGSKLIIGEELIMLRYNCFKQLGLQTHFTTNATAEELENIYGKRAYSRLNEMCNFLILTGSDRRLSGVPNIYRNMNQVEKQVNAREVTPEEIEENKRYLDDHYKSFLENGEVGSIVSIYFQLLKIYQVDMCTEEDMNSYREIASAKYSQPLIIQRGTDTEKEKDKERFISNESKKIAVLNFYEKMKKGGAKTIFGLVSFDSTQLADQLKK